VGWDARIGCEEVGAVEPQPVANAIAINGKTFGINFAAKAIDPTIRGQPRAVTG
jgi:hypothetical protein